MKRLINLKHEFFHAASSLGGEIDYDSSLNSLVISAKLNFMLNCPKRAIIFSVRTFIEDECNNGKP